MLDYNSIEIIEPGVFDLPSLISLSLVGNNLKKCVNDTFATLPNLRFLYLSSNSLQNIEPGCFNGLEWLDR